MEKVQIKTFWQAATEPIEDREYEPVSEEPSLTMQEGYESLDEMIPRIMRGEVKYIPMVYEYGADDSDDIMDSVVVDHLDDLTDVDFSRDILAGEKFSRESLASAATLASIAASARANTQSAVDGSKHGAEEGNDKLTTEPESSNSGEKAKE